MPAARDVKLFVALSAESPAFDEYTAMARVAIVTALRHTTLQPHVVYDGEPNGFTDWLARHDVPVLRHRSRFYDRIRDTALRARRPNWVGVGAGAFLRVDLPGLARAHGIDDAYVLYTDCDVMFVRDVAASLRDLRPQYFAVAPQFTQGDLGDMNSGVMWMHLDQLLDDDADFERFVGEHLDEFAGTDWDQSAFRCFYGPPRRPTVLWDALPASLNWKPYWGENPDAHVVHFHGPKPTHRARLAEGQGPGLLRDLARAAYGRYCDDWERVLAEAR